MPQHRFDRPQPHVRWNLIALMTDVSFYAIAMAFMDSTAVLPVMLQHLGASAAFIGAGAALRTLGFSVVQLFVACAMHGRRRQKPFLVFIATVSRIPLFVLPWLVYRAANSPLHRVQALWGATFILVIWALGDGLGYVPWMEIVARAFEHKVRNRFFAASQMVSGACSIVIGMVVVRGLLHSTHLPYPLNYAVLTLSSALLFQVSLLGVVLIREPDPGEAALAAQRDFRSRHTPAGYLRQIPEMLKGNVHFLKLATVQLLVGFGAAASPFYVLYAQQRFHLNDEWAGIYQALQAAGVLVLMPVWTYLGERFGHVVAIRATAVAAAFTPIVAIACTYAGPYAFGAVYFLMGGWMGWALWTVANVYLLASTPESERPIYIALINLVFAPASVFPWIGGLMAHGKQLIMVGEAPLLFVVVFVVGILGLTYSFTLSHAEAPTLSES